jgi:hypothetical protein
MIERTAVHEPVRLKVPELVALTALRSLLQDCSVIFPRSELSSVGSEASKVMLVMISEITISTKEVQ